MGTPTKSGANGRRQVSLGKAVLPEDKEKWKLIDADEEAFALVDTIDGTAKCNRPDVAAADCPDTSPVPSSDYGWRRIVRALVSRSR